MEKIPTSLPSTPHRRPNSAASNTSTRATPYQEKDTQEEEPSSIEQALPPVAFEELSDSLATLEMNMQHMLQIHNSLTAFSENFAAFLHGMKMNAWCVDFPEAPTAAMLEYDLSQLNIHNNKTEAAQKAVHTSQPSSSGSSTRSAIPDSDFTYVTNDDISFVPVPTTANSKNPNHNTPAKDRVVGRKTNIRTPAKTPARAAKLPRVATLATKPKPRSNEDVHPQTRQTRGQAQAQERSAPSRIPQASSRVPSSRISRGTRQP